MPTENALKKSQVIHTKFSSINFSLLILTVAKGDLEYPGFNFAGVDV